MTRTVAAFDFDGTLTRRDSFVHFLALVAGWPTVVRSAVKAAPHVNDRNVFKERLLAGTVGGRPHADLVDAGARYGRELAVHKIRPVMRERLAWHRAEGHEIVIVSASIDVYLEPVRAALELDGLLCTQLEVDAHGRCTGRMIDGNCRGPAKAERLRAFIGTDDATIWAYGDSAGDDAMLAMADHPVRV